MTEHAESLPNIDGRIDGRRWEDGHTDVLEASVQTMPVPYSSEDGERDLPTQPVVHVTGDAYLEPEQAKELAATLIHLADTVDTLRAADAHAQREAAGRR